MKATSPHRVITVCACCHVRFKLESHLFRKGAGVGSLAEQPRDVGSLTCAPPITTGSGAVASRSHPHGAAPSGPGPATTRHGTGSPGAGRSAGDPLASTAPAGCRTGAAAAAHARRCRWAPCTPSASAPCDQQTRLPSAGPFEHASTSRSQCKPDGRSLFCGHA